MKRLKMLVLRLWLKISAVEHDLLRKEHVLAAKARVAVAHEVEVVGEAAAAVDHLFECPLTEEELSKVEII